MRYKRIFIPFAIFAMALHRLPLALNKKCSFWKLLGCGKNGTFDLNPDWQQWALLAVWSSEDDFHRFNNTSVISRWWKLFTFEKAVILCRPLVSHGKWSGKEPFDNPHDDKTHRGPVAVLTRATIRFSRLRNFWKHVDPVASVMQMAPGYITSFGIGESPVFMQATFSIWEDLEKVREFAYRSALHSRVIKKTREEDWYSEELFARFEIIAISGFLHGKPVVPEQIKHTFKTF